jgi:IclR family transcriptional regulator, KDG regulon repressor
MATTINPKCIDFYFYLVYRLLQIYCKLYNFNNKFNNLMSTALNILKIIDLLDKEGSLKLKDMSEKLKIDNGNLYRYLQILESHNFISKSDHKNYSLGLKFLNISTKILERINIIEIAHPYLVELSEIVKEAVHLSLFDSEQVIYIDKIVYDQPIQLYSKIGKIAFYHCTALGKVTLAFQNSELINKIINNLELFSLTKNTITDKKILIEELQTIKKNGYALDNSEFEEESCCIAAPIKNHNGEVKNAISISSLKFRCDIDKLIGYKDLLIEKCNFISKKIGGII